MTVENTGTLIIPQLQSTIVQLRAECEALKLECDRLRQSYTILEAAVIDLPNDLTAQLATVTQERDKYKKEALIKFDCQVCSGALEAENEQLQQQLATASNEIARLREKYEIAKS